MFPFSQPAVLCFQVSSQSLNPSFLFSFPLQPDHMVNQLNCILTSTLNFLNSNFWPQLSCQCHTLNQSNWLFLRVVPALPRTAGENDIAMLTWLYYKFIISNLSWFLSATWQLFYSSPVCFLSHPQQLFHSFVTFPKSLTSPSTFRLLHPEKNHQAGALYISLPSTWKWTQIFMPILGSYLSPEVSWPHFLDHLHPSPFSPVLHSPRSWCLPIEHSDHHCYETVLSVCTAHLNSHNT